MSKTDTKASVETDGQKGRKASPLVICCIALMVVVIVLLCVVIITLNKKQTLPEPDVVQPTAPLSGRGTLVTPDNVQELIEQAQSDANTDASYTASMNIDWYFEDGASVSSNAYVENHASNSRTVYFDLFLAESEQLVYSSPYIPVGSTLQEFALDERLARGDYPAVCVYHLVDDEHNEVSTVSVAVTLHVLNE